MYKGFSMIFIVITVQKIVGIDLNVSMAATKMGQ